MTLHPRRHAGLLYKQGDRDPLLRRSLAELVAMRARERARQADHRRERDRVKRRGPASLGRPGADGLTVREIDTLVAQQTEAERFGITVAELEVLRGAGLIAAIEQTAIVEGAFRAAEMMLPRELGRTSDGWGFVLSAERLVARTFLAMRFASVIASGYGSRPISNIDSLWLVSVRSFLSNDEIGRVLAAADGGMSLDDVLTELHEFLFTSKAMSLG